MIIKVNNEHNVLNEDFAFGQGVSGCCNYNNTGFSYEIKPLAFNLQQKGNDDINISKNKAFKCFKGDIVKGYCPYDKKKHQGLVQYVYYMNDSITPKYVYIQDMATQEIIPLESDSIKHIKDNMIYQPKELNYFNKNYNSVDRDLHDYSPIGESIEDVKVDFNKSLQMNKLTFSLNDFNDKDNDIYIKKKKKSVKELDQESLLIYEKSKFNEIIKCMIDKEQLTEKQKVNLEKCINDYHFTYRCNSRDELKNIIAVYIKAIGPVCDLNWIDVSCVGSFDLIFDSYNLYFWNKHFENIEQALTCNISKWNTRNVKTMVAMFQGVKIKNMDFSNFNTSNVTNMSQIFNGAVIENCTGFENWDVSNVTNLSNAFSTATLKSQDTLGISKWNTSKVKLMNGTFSRAFGFKDDISKWDVSNVISYDDIFYSYFSEYSLPKNHIPMKLLK